MFVFVPRFRKQKLILVLWFSGQEGKTIMKNENEKYIVFPESRSFNLYPDNVKHDRVQNI